MLNFTALPYIHITQLQTAVFYIIGKMIKVEQLKRLYTRHTSCLLSVFQLKCIAVFYLFNCSDNLAQFVSCHMLRPKLTHTHIHIYIDTSNGDSSCAVAAAGGARCKPRPKSKKRQHCATFSCGQTKSPKSVQPKTADSCSQAMPGLAQPAPPARSAPPTPRKLK